jgi:hypothetical protein
MSVGVTKDYKLKVRNLHASHTQANIRYTLESKTKICVSTMTNLLSRKAGCFKVLRSQFSQLRTSFFLKKNLVNLSEIS